MRAKWSFKLKYIAVPLVFITFCLHHHFSYSQEFKCKIVFNDQPEPLLGKKCRASDSVSLISFFESGISKLNDQGYLDARIDSISYSSISAIAYGEEGLQYKWYFQNMGKPGIYARNIFSKLNNQPININQLNSVTSESLRHMENNGYPFAKISFDSAKIVNNKVSVDFLLTTGPHIVYDTLYINGELDVSNRFLQSYLGCKNGASYSEKVVNRINKRLNSLPFVSTIKPVDIEFTPGKARIYTYLNKRRANRFSGFVGFGTPEDPEKKIALTGDIDLKLLNSFRNAETITLQWNAPGNSSQRILINTSWPYILGSSMVFDAHFSLYKRDTSYLTINPVFSAGFYTNSTAKLSLFFSHKSSRTTASSTPSLLNGLKISSLGFSYGYSNIAGYKLFSTGVNLTSKFSAGHRTIHTYEQSKSSTIVEAEVKASVTYKIYRSIVFGKNSLNGALMNIVSNNVETPPFFENEMYRLGGSNFLRGFNEESILTNRYLLSENDLYLMLGESLSLFTFIDVAVADLYQIDEYKTRTLLGTGMGFSLQTRSGKLSVIYAMGEGAGQTLSVRDARIHIKYDTFF